MLFVALAETWGTKILPTQGYFYLVMVLVNIQLDFVPSHIWWPATLVKIRNFFSYMRWIENYTVLVLKTFFQIKTYFNDTYCLEQVK
jgi:hypothetical protein